MGVIALLLVSCAPKQDSPVLNVDNVIQKPADSPEPEAKAQNQVLYYIKHPYYPKNFTVDTGQEILFINDYYKFPIVIVGDKQDPFTSDPIDSGTYFVHVYMEPGNYTYIISPGQSGVIEVLEKEV